MYICLHSVAYICVSCVRACVRACFSHSLYVSLCVYILSVHVCICICTPFSLTVSLCLPPHQSRAYIWKHLVSVYMEIYCISIECVITMLVEHHSQQCGALHRFLQEHIFDVCLKRHLTALGIDFIITLCSWHLLQKLSQCIHEMDVTKLLVLSSSQSLQRLFLSPSRGLYILRSIKNRHLSPKEHLQLSLNTWASLEL